MKLYQKLTTSFFFFLGGILLLSAPITARSYESSEGEKKTHTHVKTQKESSALLKNVLAESKERLFKILPELNPFWFVVSFTFTFPIVHFVIDVFLVKANISNPRETKSKWQMFLVQGVLFYIINSIKNILHISILKVLLEPLEVFSKIYSLVFITISTLFMGICILMPSWYLGLALLLSLTIAASILIPSKNPNKKAYLLTNILFVIITWLSIKGIWYILVEMNYSALYKILKLCELNTTNSSTRKEGTIPLLLSSGNLNFVVLWHQLKDSIYIYKNGNYTTLADAVNSNEQKFILSPILNFINNLPQNWQHIIYATSQNIIFEHAKEWLF